MFWGCFHEIPPQWCPSSHKFLPKKILAVLPPCVSEGSIQAWTDPVIRFSLSWISFCQALHLGWGHYCSASMLWVYGAIKTPQEFKSDSFNLLLFITGASTGLLGMVWLTTGGYWETHEESSGFCPAEHMGNACQTLRRRRENRVGHRRVILALH